MQCLGLVAIDKAGSALEEGPHGDFCSQGAEGNGYGIVCGVNLVTGRWGHMTGTCPFSVSAWGGVEGFTEDVAI